MRCKPGDMAIVVNAYVQENIGREVEVVGLVHGNTVKMPDGAICNVRHHPSWQVTVSERPLMAVSQILDIARRTKYAVFPDAWLMPIRPGDEANSKTTERKKETA